MTQTQTAHTPGPWRVSLDTVSCVKTGRLVADCERTPHSERPAPPDAEDMANARLIAAAPDLLAALVAMVAADTAICEGAGSKADQAMSRIAALDMAAAAIARATGAQ